MLLESPSLIGVSAIKSEAYTMYIFKKIRTQPTRSNPSILFKISFQRFNSHLLTYLQLEMQTFPLIQLITSLKLHHRHQVTRFLSIQL